MEKIKPLWLLILLCFLVFDSARAFGKLVVLDPKEKNQSDSRIWHLQALLGMNFFGPVSYDKLGVFQGTGVERPDPNLRSLVYGLRFGRILPYGLFYVKPFGRSFDTISNYEKGTFDDGAVGFERSTRIRSNSLGIELGYEARKRLRDIFWFPFIGTAFEKNTVQVTGELSRENNPKIPLELNSDLTGAYLRFGTGMRPFLYQTFEFEIILAAAYPLWSQKNLAVLNKESDDLEKRLNHGLRGALILELAFSVLP